MSFGGRIDRRYCRPACRTLAYGNWLRTRGIDHGPTAVPHWAIGRLPKLSIALTTLGRVQGDVTVLARQMEYEEAAVRAWLLRLRELGDMTPDVPPPDPKVRLRADGDRLRADLAEALAQRNKLEEQLRDYQAQTGAKPTKLAKELESVQRNLNEQADLHTKFAGEFATLTADEANARKLAGKLQAQHIDDEAELTRLRKELSSAQSDAKSVAEKLRTIEQDRGELNTAKARLKKELAALRATAKKPVRSTGPRALPTEDGHRPTARTIRAHELEAWPRWENPKVGRHRRQELPE